MGLWPIMRALTTAEIHAKRPIGSFRGGCQGGESPEQVAARADTQWWTACAPSERIVLLFRAAFYAGVSRFVVALRSGGRKIPPVSTARLSVRGYDNNIFSPGQHWNDTRHVTSSNLEATDVQTKLKETFVMATKGSEAKTSNVERVGGDCEARAQYGSAQIELAGNGRLFMNAPRVRQRIDLEGAGHGAI